MDGDARCRWLVFPDDDDAPVPKVWKEPFEADSCALGTREKAKSKSGTRTARSDHRGNVTQPPWRIQPSSSPSPRYEGAQSNSIVLLPACGCACVTRTLVFCGCACAPLRIRLLPAFLRSFPFLTYDRALLRSICYTACTQYVVSERNAAFLRREVLLSLAARVHVRTQDTHVAGPIALSIAEVAVCSMHEAESGCSLHRKRRFEEVRHIGFVSP
ncbi:hypothetical protein BKA58DRAFT_397373 [Alternaria rosae]|uniref:uncharacterized protein n=1 Tax=Alternaria rosae TaxID=1187941 RepID=UPI001E8EDFB5|nr:uncharacterized protein BKA58DRAFT_397373 [Alternaria rosae]KAH6883162.1 hypothetical protein BKA58DRAFT_397373 [Alternaria rosae]